jgi:carbon monoxide dehydrogenase subunit G
VDIKSSMTVPAPPDEVFDLLLDVERIAPCMPGAQLTEIEGDTYRGTVSVKVGPITAKFKGEANFVEQDAAAHKAVLKAAGRDTGGKGNASALITAQLSEVSKDTTHVKVTTDLTITGKVAQFGRGALADVSTKLIDQFVQQLETTVLNEPDAAPAAGAADSDDTKPAAPKKAAAAKKAPAKKAAAPAPSPSPSSASDAPGAEAAGEDDDVDTAAVVEAAEKIVADAAPATPAVRKIEGPEAQPIDLIDTAGGAMLKRLLPLGLVAVILLIVLRRRGRSDD